MKGFAKHFSPLIVCAGVTVCALLGFSLIMGEELAGADYTAAPGQKQKLRQKLPQKSKNMRTLERKPDSNPSAFVMLGNKLFVAKS